MIQIDETLENWLKEKGYVRKGRGKHEIAKLCDELKKSAVKMWQYAMQEDILGNRNSFSKTDPDATFMHMKYCLLYTSSMVLLKRIKFTL